MKPLLFSKYESAGAEFDEPSRIYRYRLWRMWGGGSLRPWRTVLWIMLNPSTADEHVLDPTLRRCEGFSIAWGYDGFGVCNVYAWRSTDPDQLLSHPDIDGPGERFNEQAVADAVSRADLVVCGWGNHRIFKTNDRDQRVRLMLKDAGVKAFCLGHTQDGQPRHPLYMAASTPLVDLRRLVES